MKRTPVRGVKENLKPSADKRSEGRVGGARRGRGGATRGGGAADRGRPDGVPIEE